MKVYREVGHHQQRTPIDFEVNMSRVKVTVAQNNKMVSG
jgi:hypothetical protein